MDHWSKVNMCVLSSRHGSEGQYRKGGSRKEAPGIDCIIYGRSIICIICLCLCPLEYYEYLG